MDHKRDALANYPPGGADDEGDSTPAIVLNTQSNLLSLLMNKRKDTAGKSIGNNSFKIQLLFFCQLIGLNGNLATLL